MMYAGDKYACKSAWHYTLSVCYHLEIRPVGGDEISGNWRPNSESEKCSTKGCLDIGSLWKGQMLSHDEMGLDIAKEISADSSSNSDLSLPRYLEIGATACRA